MNRLAYLFSLSIPISIGIALHFRQEWSWLTLVYTFGFLPFLELFLLPEKSNPKPNEDQVLLRSRYYDLVLWAMVPIQYGIIVKFLHIVSTVPLKTHELAGLIFSVGIGCGVLGINVAHELGHRKSKIERVLARILLLSTLYWQFYIEHNQGHHRNVSTQKDPESSRLNEPLYYFWIRAIRDATRNAIHLAPFEMGFAFLIELTLLLVIQQIYGGISLIAFMGSSLIGVLLLQSVNYIEHYGLTRKLLAEGSYEKVLPCHSWNADHPLSRMVLFELSRHSDHHAHATRKYQILRSFESSPQLPSGYPGMILLALLPPLWFRVMNPHLQSELMRLKA